MDAVSLQPAAGAQGELAGVLMIRAYHQARGREADARCSIPDSAHGTNPASTALAGFEVVEVKSDAERRGGPRTTSSAHLGRRRGGVHDHRARTRSASSSRASIEIAELCHASGVQVYMDGANLNAILGITRPGDLGFDVCTSTCTRPSPRRTAAAARRGPGRRQGAPRAVPAGAGGRRRTATSYALDWKRPQSIGKLQAFWGNFGMLVRAYTYIRTMGADGLRAVSRERGAQRQLHHEAAARAHYDVAAPGPCMHECVLSARRQKKLGVTAIDIAKRLLDSASTRPRPTSR